MQPQLTHLFMEVGDLVRARWFWTEGIGLELLEDRGPYIRVGGGGGFALGIEQAPDGRARTDGDEICVRVANVDALTDRLRRLGVTIVEPPADQPWGGRHAWLLDPDGRRISIYSADRPIM
jgi:catechol 2,3-dioxygenase-like lactoylglutathione lyase family enzyme